jgi:hypothetical protein
MMKNHDRRLAKSLVRPLRENELVFLHLSADVSFILFFSSARDRISNYNLLFNYHRQK